MKILKSEIYHQVGYQACLNLHLKNSKTSLGDLSKIYKFSVELMYCLSPLSQVFFFHRGIYCGGIAFQR